LQAIYAAEHKNECKGLNLPKQGVIDSEFSSAFGLHSAASTSARYYRGAAVRRHNEHCPIHKSLSCCGRELIPNRPRLIRLGVQRIEDPHYPRGYRDLRSPAEMRKLLNRKIVEQNRMCAICHVEFTDYGDIVPDHRDHPKGMGGAWRNDHPDKIQATHGGVMGKKDRREWMTDDRSVG
jgi:hypothetical protein